MKLNQVSIQTRTVNPNLNNHQKVTKKNPGFGARVEFGENFKKYFDSCNPITKVEIKNSFKHIAQSLSESFVGYLVKIDSNRELKWSNDLDIDTVEISIIDENTNKALLRKDLSPNNKGFYRCSPAKFLAGDIDSCYNPIQIIKTLEGFAFCYANSIQDCETSKEMEEKYNQTLEFAQKMNVTHGINDFYLDGDKISGYKTICTEAIAARKAQENAEAEAQTELDRDKDEIDKLFGKKK